MRLYHIQFDGQSYYVEAPDMPAAIALWKKHWESEGDYDGEEPESCALVHDEAVIR